MDTCVWAGVDSVWEQKKIEAKKGLKNRAESHLSGARIVRQRSDLRFSNSFVLI